MRIDRAVNYVTTLGPGRRLCIWVNGCSRGCKGCVSPNLQRVDESTEVDIFEYFFRYNLEAIDGVTISGGEPFEQASELWLLVSYLKQRGVRDILIYTGYTYEELKAKRDPDVEAIFTEISVLIDGPYVKELDFGTNNIKGSENQKIHYLDPSVRHKYTDYIKSERSVCEMTLGSTCLGIGIPDEKYITDFYRSNKKSDS